MPEFEGKLDTLIDSVGELNEKHAKFQESTDAKSATAEKEINEIKEKITQTVEAMNESKNELKAQKESFELMQKEFIEKSAGGENEEEIKGMLKEYDDHLSRYLKKGVPVPQEDIDKMCTHLAKKTLFGADDDMLNLEAKALVAGSNTDGGFWLTADRSNTMSMRLFQTSNIRPIANVQTTTSDMFEVILDDDEPDAGWVGEVDSRPDTATSQIGLIKIPVQELYAQPMITQKLIDDAGFDIAAWHEGKVTRRFMRLENEAFVTGDGSQRPRGFLSYSAWDTAATYQRNAVEQRSTAVSTTIDGDDLISLKGDLLEEYHPMSQWAMSRQTFFNNILTIQDAEGQYLVNPRVLREGGDMALIGRPVNFFNDMPAVAANSLSICIADWSEFYTIVDRIGIRVLRDPYTNKPYIRYYTTKRVGGAVTNYQAGKILKTLA